MQMFQQFRQSPIDFLIKNKFKIPDNIGSDPQSIAQHLLNSGQITQAQVNQAQQMLPQIQPFFK